MRFLIHLVAESEAGQRAQEIARLERNELRLENIGLSLREAKQLLAAIQTRVVEQQVADYLETQRPCPRCGRIRGLNGRHPVTFQTLFGNLELRSPRWNHCGCQPNPAKTFSPLSELLQEHVSPERLYLETKWASLISFELAAHLLKDALPVAETVNAAGVRNHLHRVAERAEAALGEERGSFIEDCPQQWGEGNDRKFNDKTHKHRTGNDDLRGASAGRSPTARVVMATHQPTWRVWSFTFRKRACQRRLPSVKFMSSIFIQFPSFCPKFELELFFV